MSSFADTTREMPRWHPALRTGAHALLAVLLFVAVAQAVVVTEQRNRAMQNLQVALALADLNSEIADVYRDRYLAAVEHGEDEDCRRLQFMIDQSRDAGFNGVSCWNDVAREWSLCVQRNSTSEDY